MKPRVSVVLPNYNHVAFIQQRIESILNQTYQDFELIVLDDCSTDNSRDVIENYRGNPHVSHIVFNVENGGSVFRQWIKGVGLAKGEWIWIAESDDVADPLFLEKMMAAANLYSSAGLVYSHLRWIDAEGNVLGLDDAAGGARFYTGDEFAVQKLLYSTTIYNVSSCIFKKDAFMQLNRSFFETMKCSGDYGFYLQMTQVTDVLEVMDVLTDYRQHKANTSIKLMKDGTSLEEDLRVLDFICDRYRIPPSKYSRYWARMQTKNKCFHWNVQKKVWKLYWVKHPKIVMWSLCYTVYYRLIGKGRVYGA